MRDGQTEIYDSLCHRIDANRLHRTFYQSSLHFHIFKIGIHEVSQSLINGNKIIVREGSRSIGALKHLVVDFGDYV